MVKNLFSPSWANSLPRATKCLCLSNLGQCSHVPSCLLSTWLGQGWGHFDSLCMSTHEHRHQPTFRTPAAPLPPTAARASPGTGPAKQPSQGEGVGEQTSGAPPMQGTWISRLGPPAEHQAGPSVNVGTSGVLSGCHSFLTSLSTFILGLGLEILRPPRYIPDYSPALGNVDGKTPFSLYWSLFFIHYTYSV